MTVFRTLVMIQLALTCGLVFADANDGEFLGFAIGDRLKIDRESDIQNSWVSEGLPSSTKISVLTNTKPAEMDKVVLGITPITHTIIEIQGRVPASSPNEARTIQLRYFDILMDRYPKWKGTSTCGDKDVELVGIEDRGYESNSCILYTSKVLGVDYVLSVYYREYNDPHPDDFNVWIGLSPRHTTKKFDELHAKENQQYFQRFKEHKYKDADKDGL